jgi:type VI protein secretion system component VasK
MFLLQWLPSSILEFVIFGILGFGAVATVVSIFFINPLLRLMPSVAGTYQLIQLTSVAIFLLGIYLWGGYSTEMRWRERVEQAEAAAKEAEQKAKDANLELTKAIAQRDHAVATRGKTIIERTKEYLQGDTKVITQNLSEQERKTLEAQIEELRRAEKECPVPKLIIKGINEATIPIEKK